VRFTTLLILAVIAGPSWAQEQSDAARVVQLVAALESDPLGADSAQQREWLLRWVTETPDYTVVLCDILGPIPKTADVPYGHELLLQHMFGNVAFQISNPGTSDPARPHIAGIESLLRAYSAIVKQQPVARIPYFDELLALQRNGRLAEHMRPIVTAKCTDAVQA